MRYGIGRVSTRETRLSEPFRSRHQARLTIARRRCRNATNQSLVVELSYFVITLQLTLFYRNGGKFFENNKS